MRKEIEKLLKREFGSIGRKNRWAAGKALIKKLKNSIKTKKIE